MVFSEGVLHLSRKESKDLSVAGPESQENHEAVEVEAEAGNWLLVIGNWLLVTIHHSLFGFPTLVW